MYTARLILMFVGLVRVQTCWIYHFLDYNNFLDIFFLQKKAQLKTGSTETSDITKNKKREMTRRLIQSSKKLILLSKKPLVLQPAVH